MNHTDQFQFHEPMRLNFGGAFAALVLMVILAMGIATLLSSCSNLSHKDQAVAAPVDQCTSEEAATCTPEMLHNNCLCPRDPNFDGSRMGSLNDDEILFGDPTISPHAARF
jgi:hypothetical protein